MNSIFSPNLGKSPEFWMRLFGALFLFFASMIVGRGQNRWERIYQPFPGEKETAFGVQSTPDGGFLLLCSRSQAGATDEFTYFLKTDAAGAPLWTKNLLAGRAIKMKTLANGNIVVLYRNPFPSDSAQYRYALCSATGDLISDHLLGASLALETKGWDFTPIRYGQFAGGFAIPVREKYNGVTLPKLLLYDASGNQQNSFELVGLPNTDSLYIRSIIQADDSNFYGVGFTQFISLQDADPFWFRVALDGTVLGDTLFNEPDSLAYANYDMWHDIAQAADGNYWVLGLKHSLWGPEFDSLYLSKIDHQCRRIHSVTLRSRISNLEFLGEDHSEIIPLPDGGAILMFNTYDPWESDEDFSIMRVNAQGEEVWFRRYGRGLRFAEAPFAISPLSDGGYAVCGVFKDNLFGSVQSYLIRTDSLGLVFSNYVEGQVFADFNQNCQKDSVEVALGGWIVSIEKAGKSVYEAITDQEGKYVAPVDTGLVSVRILPPAPYWEACEDVLTANLLVAFDTAFLDFGIQNLGACPQLEVDLTAPFLRRCFPNTYYIRYANRGTVDIPNATVQVWLDPDLNYISADIPLYWSLGKLYTFNLGAVPVGAVGRFSIQVEVSCTSPLGASHCTTAHIFPDSTCAPQNWSGAKVEVDGNCLGTQVGFSVKNAGTNDLTTAVDFIIVEDHILLRTGTIQNLPPGMDTLILLPANGKTYRIETSQEPGAPAPTRPTVAVEGCGLDSTGHASTGYVTLFPNQDGNPFTATDCLQNIGSFDPNDKTAQPQGYGNKHYILPETVIDYKIRFQNTGTDTAFTVIIRDTLSELLDLSSFVAGASSHPYSVEMLGGRVLKFSFLNILLPDSTINERASHGFVQFAIKPITDFPLGSRIENSAAIYFDFNEPIITNTYFHTVDTGFIERPTVHISEFFGSKGLPHLVFAPNPVRGVSDVQLHGFAQTDFTSGKYRLELFNSLGSIVQTIDVRPDKTAILSANDLKNGIYFARLCREGQPVALGKLLIDN